MALAKSKLGTIGAFTALFFCACAWAQPWEGSGNPSDPYQIDSAADLVYLGQHSEYYGDDFILTADIDMTGQSITEALIAPDTSGSTGFQGDAFTGSFDGNYHKIENLEIDSLGATGSYVGLFGSLGSYSEVKNLAIEGAQITVTGSESNALGVLAGDNNGTVSQCYFSGSVTGGSGAFNLGGVVGINMSSGFENCYADVDVIAGSSSQRLGGFVGYNFGGILNCLAMGSVSGSGSNIKGFAGYNYFAQMIMYCYHLAQADGGGPTDSYAAPLTLIEMSEMTSFTGWDFFGEEFNGIDEAWMMRNSHPKLAWQVPVGMQELGLLGQYWQAGGFTQDQGPSRADWFIDNTVDINDACQLAANWLMPVVAKQYPLNLQDSFETGDFTALPWVLSGSENWVIDTTTVQDGTYSAMSGPIGDSQGCSLELTVDTTGYDLITFYYKVSTEADFDFLNFYIDGSRRMWHAGESDWIYMTFPVYDEVTTFRWTYSKDSSGTGGQDKVWIDNVVFTRE